MKQARQEAQPPPQLIGQLFVQLSPPPLIWFKCKQTHQLTTKCQQQSQNEN